MTGDKNRCKLINNWSSSKKKFDNNVSITETSFLLFIEPEKACAYEVSLGLGS